MHRRVNPHRDLIGVLAGDPFIHVEKVAVTIRDCILSQALNGVGKIQVDSQTARTDTPTFVANFFSRSRGDIARRKVPVAGIFAFQEIVPFIFWDLVRRTRVAFFLGTQTRPSFRSDSDINVSFD